ncbi:MAG: TrmB family transcriptional regulator [Alphaproteobacteria bacterium]|nr:TrmB family transcriptional regulator [Alphaproteobacteria bacterium]
MSAATDAVQLLVDLGLNRNEALAYVALLEHADPEGATGYEIGTHSGVPRSAVYKILNRLEELGAVFPLGAEPRRYVATDPQRFVQQLQHTFAARTQRAAESLGRLARRATPEPVWTVTRYDEVLERIDAMIRGATTSLYLSLWSREVERLRPALLAVADRRLHRVLHSPGPLGPPPPGFSVWSGDIPVDDRKAAWSHKALVVVDRDQALIGGTEPDADNHAVWTSNPSLVDVATNHIVLDITLLARTAGRDCSADVSPMMRPHLSRQP